MATFIADVVSAERGDSLLFAVLAEIYLMGIQMTFWYPVKELVFMDAVFHQELMQTDDSLFGDYLTPSQVHRMPRHAVRAVLF